MRSLLSTSSSKSKDVSHGLENLCSVIKDQISFKLGACTCIKSFIDIEIDYY